MCFYEKVRGWGDQYIFLGVIFLVLSQEASMELKKEFSSSRFFPVKEVSN